MHAVKGQEAIYETGDDGDSLTERLGAFVGKLEAEAKRRIDRRIPVEARWLLDLEQYHGRYSAEVLDRIKSNRGSEIFLNMTRPKANAMAARLSDLLFPTDDRNWGIEPTPVPSLVEQAEEALRVLDEARVSFAAQKAEMEGAEGRGDGPSADAAAAEMERLDEIQTAAQAEADSLHEEMNVAKDRSDLMQAEIDDQFTTCNMQAIARDAIEDACKIGIGVIKGPLVGHKPKQRWAALEIEGSGTVYQLATAEDQMPAAYYVDPWGFFPDPDVKKVADGEGVLERHLMNRKQLRALARRKDIDKDVLRTIVKDGPTTGGPPAYLTALSSITGQDTSDSRDVFQVWEYTGPIDTEEMVLLSEAFGKDVSEDEIDPLSEVQVRIWFCQGRVLSFAPHPLDSGESIYSTFSLEPDETGPFGFGVPALMRHEQAALNAANRAMMDNGALATGPQVIVNRKAVKPEDGSWTMTPRKVWVRDESIPSQIPAFEAFNIPMNQVELANIIMLARQSIDDVTATPALAQGEQGANVTKTFQGMALLLNAANIINRRHVKNYDDDITTPIVRRFYHWNMQFSRKDEIKGDYDVKARGASVLVVREMQATNFMTIAQAFGDHPTYGPLLKHEALMRAIFRAHNVPADEITKTDREIKEDRANPEMTPADQAAMAMAENAKAELQLKKDELDARIALSEGEWSARERIAQLEYDAKMSSVAEALNMKREELDRRMAETNARARDKSDAAKIKAESDERKIAVEVGEKRRTGDSAGGSI